MPPSKFAAVPLPSNGVASLTEGMLRLLGACRDNFRNVPLPPYQNGYRKLNLTGDPERGRKRSLPNSMPVCILVKILHIHPEWHGLAQKKPSRGVPREGCPKAQSWQTELDDFVGLSFETLSPGRRSA